MPKPVPKIKGLQLLAAVKLLRSRRAEALQLLPPALHVYLDERIVVSAWYPERDHVELLRAVGHFVRATTKHDPWRVLGEEGAKSDFHGPYAPLLREGDPVAMLHSMARAWPLYHDTGRIVAFATGPKGARIELHDYFLLSFEETELNAGYFTGMLRRAGANQPEIHALPYKETGDVAVWLATWS